MEKRRKYIELALLFVDIAAIFVGLVWVVFGYYCMWKYKYGPYYTSILELFQGFFTVICFGVRVFVAEIIFITCFWNYVAGYLKISKIFFAVQLILGALLIMLHLPALFGLLKGVGFILADIPLGAALVIDSVLFFKHLKKGNC